jgi:hypothetical protein
LVWPLMPLSTNLPHLTFAGASAAGASVIVYSAVLLSGAGLTPGVTEPPTGTTASLESARTPCAATMRACVRQRAGKALADESTLSANAADILIGGHVTKSNGSEGQCTERAAAISFTDATSGGSDSPITWASSCLARCDFHAQSFKPPGPGQSSLFY